MRADLTQRPGSPHPHGQFDEEQEFKIRAIVEETATHYRIEWEDDEETGQKFPSTWEPKGHANRLAVEDWEATKRRKRKFYSHGVCDGEI